MSKAIPTSASVPSTGPSSGVGPVDHQQRLIDVVRLAALSESELMDSPHEAAFDRLTRLTAKVLKVPVALVSLVDDHRQFFKSAVGLPEPWASRRETPLSHSFCQYGVTSADSFATRIKAGMSARNAEGSRRYRLSASVGAAAYEADKHETIEALLVTADALMYEQKRARHAGLLLTMAPPAACVTIDDGRGTSGRGA